MFVLDAVEAVRAALGGGDWSEAVAAVLHSGLFRRYGSRNPVFLPTQAVPPDAKVVIKKSPNTFEEARIMELAREFVRVPRVLHVDADWLVTEFVEGETLHAQFERGSFEMLPDAISLMARLQAEIPKLWVPTDLRSRLETRLRNPSVGLPVQLIHELMRALEPLFALLDAQEPRAYFDRVPVNFLITPDEEIVAIDFECPESTSPALDLANLLAYMDYTTHLWKEPCAAYMDASSVRNHGDFQATFFAAVVYRSLSFVAAWSKPDRTHLRRERANAINRALLAVEHLKPALYRLKPVQDALTQVKAHVENEG